MLSGISQSRTLTLTLQYYLSNETWEYVPIRYRVDSLYRVLPGNTDVGTNVLVMEQRFLLQSYVNLVGPGLFRWPKNSTTFPCRDSDEEALSALATLHQACIPDELKLKRLLFSYVLVLHTPVKIDENFHRNMHLCKGVPTSDLALERLPGITWENRYNYWTVEVSESFWDTVRHTRYVFDQAGHILHLYSPICANRALDENWLFNVLWAEIPLDTLDIRFPNYRDISR